MRQRIAKLEAELEEADIAVETFKREHTTMYQREQRALKWQEQAEAENARLREALEKSLAMFGNPGREEYLTEDGYAEAWAIVQQARAALAQPEHSCSTCGVSPKDKDVFPCRGCDLAGAPVNWESKPEQGGK
jgi:cell division septum initiation protein DivIVA